MRRLGSLILASWAGSDHQAPAGGAALAVDRDGFAATAENV
jgi:folate-dependent tRNA-U54 methylase TrmFO/GidA